MVALVLGMLVCVALAIAVVAMVAVPARRDGRDVLSPRGEDIVLALKDRTESAKTRLERSDKGVETPAAEQPSAEATPTEPVVASGSASE